jgi:hypothetical protein
MQSMLPMHNSQAGRGKPLIITKASQLGARLCVHIKFRWLTGCRTGRTVSGGKWKAINSSYILCQSFARRLI